MSYYLLRIGEGSKYIREAKRHGFAAVGWGNVPDLQKLGSLDKIKKSVSKNYPDYTIQQVATQSGQLYRFGLEMQPGDIIVSPLGSGEYLVGESGEYYFEESPTDVGCPFKHRRQVKWKSNIILKEDMSMNLAYSVGATLTIFSLDKYSDEIEQLIAGQKFTPADKPQRVRDIVLSALLELNGKQFEEFITHLLEAIGFSAETTKYVGDKGIDVNGILDAEGLADITLRVQVKRVRSSISNKEVLALRGALSQSEHGCFITVSSFTNQAFEEAQAPNKTLIKLIDGNDLAGLILKHYCRVSCFMRMAFPVS
jgi:restriction system protein